MPKQRKDRAGKNARAAATSASARKKVPQRAGPRLDRRGLWIAIAIIVAIAVIYWPVRHYGFVDLDDPQYVSENPVVANGLTWSGVKWAFTSIHASYWLPLIWLSHMIDVQIYGLNGGGHHVTNVMLHAINSVLLFALLHRMTGALGRSAVVAGLFAVHPLHVESVVWITERKDVLSTLFLLLTVWTYVEYTRRPSRGRYALALLWFCLGLMSKSMLVTLPFVLLLLDVWPLGRLPVTGWRLGPDQRAMVRRLVVEKIPFLLLSATFALITYLTQERTGAVAGGDQRPVTVRAANAVLSYVVYLGETLWPAKLALFYPYPRALSPLLVGACVVGLVAVTLLVLRHARRYPYLPVGWLWYLGTLVPVIGIIQAGDQARADRFTYVPLIGIFILIVWGLADVIRSPRAGVVLAVLACLGCTAAARVQVGYWETNTRLWEHALAVADESYVAHTNLGLALFADGKIDPAIEHYRAALRLRPNFAEAHNDLGVALANRGDIDGAIRSFLDALRAKPSQAASHYNAAVLLAQRGDTGAAVSHLQDALRLNPGYADARREMDKLNAGRGRP